MSYTKWNPSGTNKSNYDVQCINMPNYLGAPSIDFLKHADIIDIKTMIDERKEIIAFALTNILKDWVVSGD
jgi:hypothetical protein